MIFWLLVIIVVGAGLWAVFFLLFLIFDLLWKPVLFLIILGLTWLLISFLRNQIKVNPKSKIYILGAIITVSVVAIVSIFRAETTPENIIFDAPMPKVELPTNNEPKSRADDGRDSIVRLSFQNIFLLDNINKALQKTPNKSGLKIERYEQLGIYRFKSKLNVSGKNYSIDISILTFNDTIGKIGVTIHDNIYYSHIYPMFNEKYGYTNNSSEYRGVRRASWNYNNQSVCLILNNPQRILKGEIEKEIVTNYHDFRDISINYADYDLGEVISKLESEKSKYEYKKQQEKDSLEQARIENERRKQIQKDIRQI